MRHRAVNLIIYYRIIMMQLKSKYEMDKSLQIEDLSAQCRNLKAYKKLKKIASKDDLELLTRFLDHDIRILIHNRDATIANESPILLMLWETLWEALYQSCDQVQLAYYEMQHDIDHEGQYLEGEFVVHGLVECSHCGLIREYEHLHEIESCERCGCAKFERPRHFPRKVDIKSTHRY